MADDGLPVRRVHGDVGLLREEALGARSYPQRSTFPSAFGARPAPVVLAVHDVGWG